MGRLLRRLLRTGRLGAQVHRRRRRQRPQPRDIRRAQGQPVIGAAGELGPRHLGQGDIAESHRRGAAGQGVVELEHQPHHRRRAQGGDRHRIDRRELDEIGLEAGRGVQPRVGAAQHLLDHRRRSAAAVVLQAGRDLLQDPPRRRRLHLEGQAQDLAQPFHRKGHVLIPALPRARRAHGDAGIVLADRTKGILHLVDRQGPRRPAQGPFVGDLLRAARHGRGGGQPFVESAVAQIVFVGRQIGPAIGKAPDLDETGIADIGLVQMGPVRRLRSKDAPQVILDLHQPVRVRIGHIALEDVEAGAIAHPGPPDRIGRIERRIGRGQTLQMQRADLQRRCGAGIDQRPADRRRLVGRPRQPHHRRIVGRHPRIQHVQRLDGDRGAVQPDIAKARRRAIRPLDMQRVDDKALQPLQPDRIARIGAMLDVQLPDKTAGTLACDAEPALRRKGGTAVDVKVQPDRAGPRRAPDVDRTVAVRPDLQRAIGDRKLAVAIIADRGADIVKDHLVDDRSALQGLRQAARVQADPLELGLKAGQRVIGDLHPPDGRGPPRRDDRLPDRDRPRQAQKPGPRRAPVVVADQRGVVPRQGRAQRIGPARQIDRRRIAQRQGHGGPHVGRARAQVLRPVVGIGIAQGHPARQIADRRARSGIAVRIARRIDDSARRRRLARGPGHEQRPCREPGIVLRRAPARHADTGCGEGPGHGIGGQVDRLVGQRLRPVRGDQGATGIRHRHGPRGGGADAA